MDLAARQARRVFLISQQKGREFWCGSAAGLRILAEMHRAASAYGSSGFQTGGLAERPHRCRNRGFDFGVLVRCSDLMVLALFLAHCGFAAWPPEKDYVVAFL